MRYLLDTHEIIWWSENNKRLLPQFKKIITSPQNEILVSVISIWEMKIKQNLKKLKLKDDIEEIIEKNNFKILDLNLEHVLELENLPNSHKDPFDRILIAQSFIENCNLLTSDKIVKKYFAN